MTMPPCFFRLLRALCLTACCLLAAGCASRQPVGADGLSHSPDEAVAHSGQPLPAVQVRQGQSVHVAVSGGDAAFNADLESLLTGYLQSERGLVPADGAKGADILLRVRVEDVYPLGSGGTRVSPGRALGGTATGAVLGLLLGGTLGGRSGAAWGVGGGALVGLSTALMDSSGQNSLWGMKALVGVGRKGREPVDMHPVTVSAEGARMGREEILPALKDKLSQEILRSMQP